MRIKMNGAARSLQGLVIHIKSSNQFGLQNGQILQAEAIGTFHDVDC